MPPASDEKSPLARARERLYAQKGAPKIAAPDLTETPPPPVETWKPMPPPPPKKPGLPRSTLFLIAAGVFFVAAVAVAAALILLGGRTVSTENIDIEANGPTNIGSGDTVPLLITVRNKNPVAITDTLLSVDFPEGTRRVDNPEESLSHYSDTVGDLTAGESADRTVEAVIFGSEGQKVTLPIRLEYRTAGSNTPFIKEATYEFTITTSPLSISVGSLSRVSAGQPFTVAVAVRSNAPAPIAHAALLIEYPPGFIPSKTSPLPMEGGSLFDLGTLSPGEERVVSVTGTLSGEDSDTRIFRFTSGTRANADTASLAVSYTTTQAPITLERPFLAPTLSVNRDTSSDAVLKTGQQVDSVLSWINTLSESVRNAEVAVTLAGPALDPSTVTAANGFYRSSDRTIVFSKETVPAMGEIAPGETGMGSFSFRTKGGVAAADLRNPFVILTVSVAGQRLNERNVPTAVTATITRTLKVETDLALSARALRTAGPLENSGPWPPVVDTESTYTIAWTLSNSVNSVANARVTGVLPSYVRFTGATSPTDGSVTYSAASRTVTWNAGDVPAGTAAKTVHFQVGIVPSSSQRGQSPILITAQQAVGADRFAETRLTSVTSDLSISVTNDPAWTPTAGQVQ
ncbi:MAG TPA: hypothetical protein VFY28_00650 [Candidatus Paceibacterota bacterium]|nr:hypothetical protein [Candidatus Paceibacterota bacterium]